jgi:hypothetical protein
MTGMSAFSEELATATGATNGEQCEGQAHACRTYKRWAR